MAVFLPQLLRGGIGPTRIPTAKDHPHRVCRLRDFKRVLCWRAELCATQMPGFSLTFTLHDPVFYGAEVYGECPHDFYERAR